MSKDTVAKIKNGRLQNAIRAEYFLFFAFGITYASFLSRIVHLRELLGNIDAAAAGILLLGTSLGSVITAPIAGTILEKHSIRKVARLSIVLSGVFLVSLSLFALSGNYIACVINCFLLGIMFSMYNVSINVSGVAIEKRSFGRTLMPRFHSFFQIGAVVGTVISQIIIFFHVALYVQYLIVAVIAISIVMLKVSKVYRSTKIADEEEIDLGEIQASDSPVGGITTSHPHLNENSTKNGSKSSNFKSSMHAKGLDSTILIIGFMVLASTLCEGSGNDWITQGLVEGFSQGEGVGLIGMWVCLLTTAIVRFFGVNLIDKFGRKLVMRGCFTSAFIGIALYIFSPFLPLAIIGCFFWGIGVSLGYPIGISAASEGSHKSAFRASVVATLGNTMNIAGPPLIGLFATTFGIREALIILLPACFIGYFCAGVLKRTP